MTVKICVSILPRTIEEALNLIEKAEAKNADFIEVRLDIFEEQNNIADLARYSNIPIIAANRSPKCGGKFTGSENQRLNILQLAARSGFQYVDIELSNPNVKDTVSHLCDSGVKSIVSFHDFKETPDSARLYRIFEQQISIGAEICKIVTTATSIEDNLTVLDFTSKAHKRAKIVCFAMGTLGKPSRVLSPLFGAFFTIASLEAGRETAEGQLSVDIVRSIYRDLGLVA